MSKKVKVLKLSVKEDSESLAAKSLTDQINSECPEGYHYKDTILNSIKQSDYDNKYQGSTWVLFEED